MLLSLPQAYSSIVTCFVTRIHSLTASSSFAAVRYLSLLARAPHSSLLRSCDGIIGSCRRMWIVVFVNQADHVAPRLEVIAFVKYRKLVESVKAVLAVRASVSSATKSGRATYKAVRARWCSIASGVAPSFFG